VRVDGSGDLDEPLLSQEVSGSGSVARG